MGGFSSKSGVELIFDTFGEIWPVFIAFYSHFWFPINCKLQLNVMCQFSLGWYLDKSWKLHLDAFSSVFHRFFRNRNRSMLGWLQNGPGGQICDFHLFRGGQGLYRVPPGVAARGKNRKRSILSLEGMLGVFLHRFWALISTAGSNLRFSPF